MNGINPYAGSSFFTFLLTLFSRFASLFSGEDLGGVASDELQILVLIGVSASSSIVGTFLVLRKMTMLANSISHTILLAIVGVYLLAYREIGHPQHLFQVPIVFASVGIGCLTTFLTNFLNRRLHLQEDASIGMIFSALFALAIALITLFLRDAHLGVDVVMGNVDSLLLEDLHLVFSVLLLNGLLLFLFFKEYLITTFDGRLSQTLGISPTALNYLLMTQVSLTIVSGFRAVGVFMVLALITALPLSARFLTHSLKGILSIASGFGVLVSIFGVALSRHILSVYGIPLSTGGVVVSLIVCLFAVCALFRLYQIRRIRLSKKAV